jgi:hypothetical protein
MKVMSQSLMFQRQAQEATHGAIRVIIGAFRCSLAQ